MHETQTPKHFLRIGTQGAFEAEAFVKSLSYPSKDLFLNTSWVEGKACCALQGRHSSQAADSTQIPTVRRFHLDLAETSLVFSWSSYCPPAVSGTSCSRFPSFAAVKVAQLSQSCGLLTAEHSSAKWLSGYLH